MAMALAAVFAVTAVWPCASSAAGPPECSMIGTWYGDVGYSLRWLGVQTAGSTNTKGEMVLDWNRVSNSLLKVTVPDESGSHDLYPNATILTGGRGVWEMIAKGQYKYTWYAYGIGTPGYSPIYSVRVSGIARNTNMLGEESVNPCDYILIDFVYEVFDKFILPQDMSNHDPVATISSASDDSPGIEIRVPLMVVPPPPTP